MKKNLILTSALLAGITLPSSAALVNRYSFSETSGTTVTDSVGGAHGTIVGTGSTWSGTQLSLPGGPGAAAAPAAAYVDLPNGLLSVHSTVTFEAWYTVNGNANGWGRLWDFGSSAGGEITGQGGNTQGQDYFMYAPMRGTNINTQRNATRNLDPLGNGGTGPVDGTEEGIDSSWSTVLLQEYHIAVTWESNGEGGILTQYRDGVLTGTRSTTYNTSDMNDVNNWLGRSNWTGDGYFDGDLNEFRIWDNAFSEQNVLDSIALGPDSVIPEPAVWGLVGLSSFLLLLRRRR